MSMQKSDTVLLFANAIERNKTPLMKAVFERGADNIKDSERAAINTTKNLEIALANHLLLRALGYDMPETSTMRSGMLENRYGLADAYAHVVIGGKKLVDTPEQAKSMADDLYTSLNRHARLFVEKNKLTQIGG